MIDLKGHPGISIHLGSDAEKFFTQLGQLKKNNTEFVIKALSWKAKGETKMLPPQRKKNTINLDMLNSFEHSYSYIIKV